MQFRDPRTRWQFLPGRRLLFEELERRDLLAVMRIVDWNTLNGPNDATGDANFRTVLQAIGNETVQGNTQRVDILALQETDPPGNGDSIVRVKDVLNSLYSTTSYNLSASPVDGGGDSTGFRLRHVHCLATGIGPNRRRHADAQCHARRIPAGRLACLQHFLCLLGPSEIRRRPAPTKRSVAAKPHSSAPMPMRWAKVRK